MKPTKTQEPLYLREIRNLQSNIPHLIIGGSIGLKLHGFNLNRDLSKSDFDMISTDLISASALESLGYEDCRNQEGLETSASDFAFSYFKEIDYTHTFKMDIAFRMAEYDLINGIKVQKLHEIIYWKAKYAMKGKTKHIKDLQAILGK